MDQLGLELLKPPLLCAACWSQAGFAWAKRSVAANVRLALKSTSDETDPQYRTKLSGIDESPDEMYEGVGSAILLRLGDYRVVVPAQHA